MPSIDLAELRLVEVPDAAPPYDCETHGADCPALRDLLATGIADPMGLPGPDGPWPGVDSGRRPGTEGRAPEPAGSVNPAGTAGPAGTASPAASAAGPAAAGTTAAWPRQSAQVMVEILTGVRPVRQVVPWATDRVLAQIRGLIPGFASDRRPRIQRVVTSRPAAGVVEMTVVACIGRRTRALAMRFEHVAARPAAPGLPPRPARWLCTAIEAG
jgi:Family of unknown function (DUF6459)